ncbi:HD-GYP domain-containing protein (c-di-GMP phosphodiesterase class II) [Thermoanaerobacter pentosaceus]|uniref:HD-GYP domain-containing protein (C-di-GMP phosphodiesterase class II) n=1 Tax=Thermoanaerobacter pentosaceus TaxID=694059 RepID=A0ABT9M2H9_9THEO|nr:HD domain-containing phosphohydrolase [Thermoanaerobacter pentosaceus]MDP9750308.1 HD-GYP domain-containing protein (c-di-GMP phosphodiesterase class II) [Thermoanaerobacter pentosaceus]
MAQYSTAAHTAVFEEELKKHHMRVSKLCEKIARSMGMPHNQLLELLLASQLHDIGKLWIPKSVLNKPDKLTKEEKEIMKKHVGYGYNYIKSRKINNTTAEAVLYTMSALTGRDI